MHEILDFQKFQDRFIDLQGPSGDFKALKPIEPFSRIFQALNLILQIQGFQGPAELNKSKSFLKS